MTQLKVTTTQKVNVRKGPGISFERIGTIKEWTTLNVESVEPDVGGINWYRIEEGYICSKFCDVGITHANKTTARDGEGSNFVSPTQVTQNPITSSIKSTIASVTTGVGQGLSGVLNSFLGGSLTNEQQLEQYKRRIFGIPYQFLPATDIRPNEGQNIGRIYAANILSEAPILSIMPCKPNYLPSLDSEEKKKVFESIQTKLSEAATDLMKEAADFTIDDFETRYYATDINHTEYMKYVNLMCRAAALFMKMGDKLVPGTTVPYKQYDWTNWRLANQLGNSGMAGAFDDGATADSLYEKATATIGNAIDNAKQTITGMFGGDDDPGFLESISTEKYYVDFYVTPSTSYSESMSNRTEQSKFEGVLNSGSEMLKELIFVLGEDGLNNDAVRQSLANYSKEARDTIARMSGNSNNLFARLFGDAQTIISGSNIIFPEIYHDSDFSRSYRAEVKLLSPYGTPEAIFLNCLVPLFHIIAFALPRQTSVNSYGAPFLIKAHIGKWFSCEMGIVDSIEITKDDWVASGFPSQYTVSISFKDLYSSLSMSKFDSPKSAYLTAQNQALIEYLAILCGLNMKKSEWEIKMNTLTTLLKNMPGDYVTNKSAEIQEGAANAAARVLGGVV